MQDAYGDGLIRLKCDRCGQAGEVTVGTSEHWIWLTLEDMTLCPGCRMEYDQMVARHRRMIEAETREFLDGRGSSGRQALDFRWYTDALPSLYERYGDCELVISRKRVWGAFASHSDAYEAAERGLGSGNYIIQKCGPDEGTYTVGMVSHPG